MASNEDILKEADYYLENDVTIEKASSDLGISKRTLQLHLKKLESIAPEKAKLVADKKLNNEKQGRILGGTLGKRMPSWTHEEAKKVANQMLNQEMTYREAEDTLGIPKSTLHEMVHNGNIDDETTSLLYALSEANKKGLSVSEFIKENNSEHVASDITAKQMQENENYGKKSR